MAADAAVVVRAAEAGEDDAAVVALILDYLTWATGRLADDYGVDWQLPMPGEVQSGLTSFRPPDGALVLAQCDGAVAGVGALRTLAPGTCEVKRMFVAPRWRGLGVGSALLDRLLEEASARGASRVVLDSSRFMEDAHRLYTSRGFEERPPYDGSEIRPAYQHLWRFFELDLGASARA